MSDELLEVLKENGEGTGEMRLRSEVHNTGVWRRTVQVWILNDNDEVILQRRQLEKEGSPGKWDVSAGGHCVNGDSSLESTRRELLEELGLEFTYDKFVYLGTRKYTSQQGKNNEFVDIYLIRYNFDIHKVKFQEEEIDAVKSMSVSELKEMYEAGDVSLAKRDIALNFLFDYREKLGKIELFDLYDIDRNKTGETMIRGTQVPEGRFYTVVVIWVENSKGEFLVQKTSKEKDNLYGTTGGHVTMGNTSMEGILQEVSEELGIELEEGKITLIRTERRSKNFEDIYYIKKDIEIDQLTLQKEEVDYVEWMSVDRIESLIKKDKFRNGHARFFEYCREWLRG